MSGILIINDASLPFSSSLDCGNNIDEFFDIIYSANHKGIQFNRGDELEGSWNSLIYAEGFELGQWINNITSADRRRLIKDLMSKVKCPLVPNIQNLHQDKIFVLSSDQDIEVKALGIASIQRTHGVSFASHDNWKSETIDIIKIWDDQGTVQEEQLTVSNIFSKVHLKRFLVGFEADKQRNRNYLRNLHIERNEDFPNLIFCSSALKNFRSSTLSNVDFNNIIMVLNKLNEAITQSNNKSDLILHTGLSISAESDATMNNRKYSRQRVFDHPSLGPISFQDHVKNFTNSKRLHIYTEYENNKICIGYFGSHLPTTNNPT